MNSALELLDGTVESLRPGDVQLYLTSRGWVGTPYGSGGKGLQFFSPSFPQVDLLLPLKRDLGDYSARMKELVAALAALEQRPVWGVLDDLSIPSGDILRLRNTAPAATLGNLPLDEGIKLVQGGRDLFAAAAGSTIRPQAFHPRKMPKKVADFVASCRLGQTERGSFIATIIAPVPPEIQRSLDFHDADFPPRMEPFPRRVTTRLMTTLGFVSDAIQTGAPGKILEGINEGVSADLCDALKTMKPSGNLSRLDISMSWARTRGRVPATVRPSVSFPQESFRWIEEAGRTLRMRPTPRHARFQGKLIQVTSVRRPLFREVAGHIVLKTEVGGVPSRVKVDLEQEDFGKACEALRDGKDVTVSGIIRNEVKAREYELTEPSGFEVLDRS